MKSSQGVLRLDLVELFFFKMGVSVKSHGGVIYRLCWMVWVVVGCVVGGWWRELWWREGI